MLDSNSPAGARLRKVKVVGILNCTPDSFSDGGRFVSANAAIDHARALSSAGADLIDIGGEATGPGALPVSQEEELRRIMPIVTELAPRICLSIDTYKASVAAECLKCGAQMINDVSGLRADAEMVSVVREFSCPVVIMFSKEERGLPHVSEAPRNYDDIVLTIRTFFEERIEFCLKKGLNESQLILDPGMGRFLGLNPDLSWEVLRRLLELSTLGFPLFVGTSRKGFLGPGPMEIRDANSSVSSIVASLNGANYVRIHNVLMFNEIRNNLLKLHFVDSAQSTKKMRENV